MLKNTHTTKQKWTINSNRNVHQETPENFKDMKHFFSIIYVTWMKNSNNWLKDEDFSALEKFYRSSQKNI